MHLCEYCGYRLADGEQCKCPSAIDAVSRQVQASIERHNQSAQKETAGQPWQPPLHDDGEQLRLYTPQESGAQPWQHPPGGADAKNTASRQDAAAQQPWHQAEHGYDSRHGHPPNMYPCCQRGYCVKHDQHGPHEPPYMAQVQQVNMLPGSVMLKVSGILMTVFAGVYIMWTAMMATDQVFLDPAFYSYATGIHKRLLVYYGFGIMFAGFMLAFGIAGITMSSKSRKGSAVIGFGVTLLMLNLISCAGAFYIAYYIANMQFANIFFIRSDLIVIGLCSLLFNSALPILYIISGCMRRKGVTVQNPCQI